jgi:hypothetical protein
VVSLAELTGKLDTTRVRVTDGDIPAGDWIFNGQGLVLTPAKTNGGSCSKEKEQGEKVIVHLAGKMRLIPRKAEEFGPLRQFASDMSPLAGTVAGVTLLGGIVGAMGAMTGFAAGQMLGRNIATFTCELDDGRKFNAMADYKIFRRLQGLSHS